MNDLLTRDEIQSWLEYENSEGNLHRLSIEAGVNYQTIKRLEANPGCDTRLSTVKTLSDHFRKLAVREALEWYAAQDAA